MNKGFVIAIIFILGAVAIGSLLYFVSGNVPASQQTAQSQVAPKQTAINQACEDYYKSDCPDSCVICPSKQDGTIEEATCHTNDFCTSLGFDEMWYVYQVDA